MLQGTGDAPPPLQAVRRRGRALWSSRGSRLLRGERGAVMTYYFGRVVRLAPNVDTVRGQFARVQVKVRVGVLLHKDTYSELAARGVVRRGTAFRYFIVHRHEAPPMGSNIFVWVSGGGIATFEVTA
jgi:hypothetical protein